MARKNRTPAVAYLRTSSSTNVGADKDSDKRQRAAIEAFAKHAGFEIVAELYNQAVSGADPIDARPAFAAMLEHIAGNGARTIIVETANRFARDRRSSTISEPPPLIAGRRPLVAASAPSVSPSSAARHAAAREASQDCQAETACRFVRAPRWRAGDCRMFPALR